MNDRIVCSPRLSLRVTYTHDGRLDDSTIDVRQACIGRVYALSLYFVMNSVHLYKTPEDSDDDFVKYIREHHCAPEHSLDDVRRALLMSDMIYDLFD
jgi:hypothetical protein